jgi:hypothetical protein
MADPVPPELKASEVDPDMVDIIYSNVVYNNNVNDGKGDPVWNDQTFQKISAYNLAVRAYNEAQKKGRARTRSPHSGTRWPRPRRPPRRRPPRTPGP